MTLSDASKEQGVPIRLLVSNLSGVMLELVTQLLQNQPDMMLVEQVDERVDLLVKAGDNIDLVLLGASQIKPLPPICSHLLNEYPHLKILVLKNSGDEAVMYWLGLRQRKLRTLSSNTLLKGLYQFMDIDQTV